MPALTFLFNVWRTWGYGSPSREQGCCGERRGEGGKRLRKTGGEGSGCRGGAASWERSQTLAGALGLHGENHPRPFLAIPSAGTQPQM